MLARVCVLSAIVALATSEQAIGTEGTTFNCHSYLARYTDLQNAFGTNCNKAYDHYVIHGMGEGRTAHYTGKSFDCHGYLSRYPDLQNAFGSDCTKAFNHYVKHGNSESRDASANEEEFQCESYLLRYPDLEAAFGHDCEAGFAHYLQYGMGENRDASKDTSLWHCESYLKRYPDLMNAAHIGDNCNAAFNHYVKHGSSDTENRDASYDAGDASSFDCHSYLDAHDDLAAAFRHWKSGSDCVATFAHFVQYGRHETRTSHYTGEWDCDSYLGRYPGLRAAFGTSCDRAFQHYYLHGESEGRDASATGQVQFELEVAGQTAAEVESSLPAITQAIASSLNLAVSQVTVTIESRRRLLEASSLTLSVVITGASSTVVESAVTTPYFATAVSSELQNAGVTTSLSVDGSTFGVVLTTQATCSVACEFNTVIQVTHDTTSAHTHHMCYKEANACVCKCCDSATSDCAITGNYEL